MATLMLFNVKTCQNSLTKNLLIKVLLFITINNNNNNGKNGGNNTSFVTLTLANIYSNTTNGINIGQDAKNYMIN